MWLLNMKTWTEMLSRYDQRWPFRVFVKCGLIDLVALQHLKSQSHVFQNLAVSDILLSYSMISLFVLNMQAFPCLLGGLGRGGGLTPL